MARRKKTSYSASKDAESTGNSFVLMVGDEGAVLVLMRKSQVVRRLFAASADEATVKPLVELMQANPKAGLRILLDSIDQSYVRHTLPPVSALSVNGLIKRRLEREYNESDITGFLPLGREKAGRKDWNFLLVSVPNSDALQRWLDIVLELPNPFKGIYLTPAEGQEYIKAFSKNLPPAPSGEESEWKLLVSHHKTGGFRQIVLRDDKMVFTRLAQSVGDNSPAVVAGNVEQEILNTIEYLRRMGYNEAAGLDMFIITGQEVKDALDVSKLNARRAELFIPKEASELLGLGQAAIEGDRFGDVVMAAFVGKHKKPVLKLNVPYAEKLEKIYLVRTVVRAVGVMAFLGCIYMAFNAFMEYNAATDGVGRIEDEAAQKKQELQKLQAVVEQLPKDSAVISKTITMWRFLSESQGEPQGFVRQLASIDMGSARLVDVAWDARTVIGKSASNNAQNNAQLEGDAHSVNIVLKLFFDMANPSRDEFLGETNTLLERFKEKFPRYSVAYRKLSTDEKQEDAEVKLNFDDAQSVSGLLSEEALSVEMEISGPLAETESLNAAGGGA